MAGDWIKVELTTPDKPEVVLMAVALKIDQDAVVGKLFRLWAWADQNSIDGQGVTVTRAFIDRLAARKGFAKAMITVGWLAGADGNLTFPNFTRHNGTSAKARAEVNRRAQNHRERHAKGTVNVTPGPLPAPAKSNTQRVTGITPNALRKPLPEGEKRRERERAEYSSDVPSEGESLLCSEAAEGPSPGRNPSLQEAMAFAPQAGIDPHVAEVWWHDCDSRGLSATGRFLDKSGHEIRHWPSALTSFGRRWQDNERSRGPSRGTPAPGEFTLSTQANNGF
jgi:hypothetical protein